MLKAETKKWGNSLGIVIPKRIVKDLNLKPHEEIVIEIKRSGNALKDLFGTLHWKKPIRDVLDETRKELESKYDR